MSVLRVLARSLRDLPLLVWRLVATRARQIRPRRSPTHERTDLERHDVQPGIFLLTYWKDSPEGVGPCVSLHIHDVEALRFDCFGEQHGHYHIDCGEWDGLEPGRPTRLRFAERTTSEQIDRACFELRENARYHLERSWDRGIQRGAPDPKRLADAVAAARERMRTLQRSSPPTA